MRGIGQVHAGDDQDAEPAGNSGKPVDARLRARIERELLAASAPMYAVDLSGSLIYANAEYQRLAGEVAGANGGRALLSPSAFDEVKRAGRAVDVEESLGDNRHYRSHHVPVTDDSGAVVAVTGVYYDVTRERASSQRASRIQDRFDDITRLISDWVWEVDRDFNFTFVSARVMEVFGVHPRLLLGSNLFDLGVFTADHEPAPDHNARTPFRDKVFRVMGADGRPRLCRLSGMPIFDTTTGAFVGYRGTGNDITAQVEAEERASRAQTRLGEAIEASSEAFALFDHEDRLVICNSRFREYYPSIARLMKPGVSYEALMRAGARAGEFADAPQGDAAALEAWVAREVERQRNPRGGYEQRLSDGRWLKASDRRTGDGAVVCMRTDITELKRREHALQKAEEASRAAREAAELANRAKSEFLANVSHELRTPLNAIIGFSEIIIAEMFGPLECPQYKEYVKDIHDSGTHLYNLINDILDVSKAEAGKLELSEDVVDVGDAIERCLRLVAERAERGEVGLEAAVSAGLPKLWADERKIKQILLNLLSNAVKFTPAGGRVTIDAGVDNEGAFFFTVADTGIGIAAADVPTVMAPFGQVDSRLARRYEGTGLGLPLTKALVELHGGTLELESEVDVGTTITVRFPPERVREA